MPNLQNAPARGRVSSGRKTNKSGQTTVETNKAGWTKHQNSKLLFLFLCFFFAVPFFFFVALLHMSLLKFTTAEAGHIAQRLRISTPTTDLNEMCDQSKTKRFFHPMSNWSGRCCTTIPAPPHHPLLHPTFYVALF